MRIWLPAISQRNANMFRAMHHVAIGQDKAIRRDDEARNRCRRFRVGQSVRPFS